MTNFQFKKEEWLLLISEFNFRCVRCGLQDYHLDKDHILPTYQNGNGKIENIQPLCAWCNASKGRENFNWKEFRRKEGWSFLHTKLPKSHPYNNG